MQRLSAQAPSHAASNAHGVTEPEVAIGTVLDLVMEVRTYVGRRLELCLKDSLIAELHQEMARLESLVAELHLECSELRRLGRERNELQSGPLGRSAAMI